MFPFLSNLYSLNFISKQYEINDILDALPISNLRTLSILSLHCFKTRITNITNLTISFCSLEHLFYNMFNNFPMLKYLNIQIISRYTHPIENDRILNKSNGLYLNELIIGLFKYNLNAFEIFIKQIPNLKNLSINTNDDITMINANRWKNLIQTSLPYLNKFKFNFSCNRKKYKKKILCKLFKQFQNDFWCKQHQWYTEISLEKSLIFIYTIPYLSKNYILGLNTKRFPNTSINPFDQVINLTLNQGFVPGNSKYYFSNIELLALVNSDNNQNLIDINYLKIFVNLSNLNHLNIERYERILTSSLLLEILKESPQLSQITMNSSDLMLLLNENDDELCEYLKKMIKKLNIYERSQPSFNNSDEIKKFCEIFSNIKQLRCYVNQSNDVFYLINHLSKLLTINVYLPPLGDRNYFSDLFEEESHRLNFTYRVNGIELKAPELSIWISRNII